MREINPNKFVFILSVISFIIVTFTIFIIGVAFNIITSNEVRADAPTYSGQDWGSSEAGGGPYGCGDPGGINSGTSCESPW